MRVGIIRAGAVGSAFTLTGATPPRRSLRFWRNYGPTLIYKQGECDTRSIPL
jgi:hypothetical protein